jgi:hypothetical protein
MKKQIKARVSEDFSPSPEEYRIFSGQPGQVLARYALAKRCMATAMPISALAAVHSPPIALAFSFLCGLIGFLLLRKKYGIKGALVPFFSCLAGASTGVFVVSPLLSHVLALKEAYGGI